MTGKGAGIKKDATEVCCMSGTELSLVQTRDYIVKSTMNQLAEYVSNMVLNLSLPELLLPIITVIDTFVTCCENPKYSK